MLFCFNILWFLMMTLNANYLSIPLREKNGSLPLDAFMCCYQIQLLLITLDINEVNKTPSGVEAESRLYPWKFVCFS